MAIEDDFLSLSKQLYPHGRAFWIPEGGTIEGLCKAVNSEKIQFFNDATSIYGDLLPDNDNFSAVDATIWERIYGLSGNAILLLSQRKQALIQAMSFPGQQPARCHYLFIQAELQAAGFNVYIYENIFPNGSGGFKTKTPFEVSGVAFPGVQYGQFNYGQSQYGQKSSNKIVNFIKDSDDLHFNLGGSLVSSFFIGGNTLGSFANVPASRHNEFRQLILKLKPVQNVGFLFINYV